MYFLRLCLAATVLVGLLAATVLHAQDSNLLQEGGFEGGLGPWQGYSATLATVETPVRGGAKAASLTVTGTGWAYQSITVVPGSSYTFSGWVLKNGAAAADVRLRLTWLSSGGESLKVADSETVYADSPDYQFRSLATAAPSQAKTVRAMVMLTASTSATVYLDDLELLGPSAEPLPTPTATPTSVPSATPTPSPTPTPTAQPTATSTPTLVPPSTPMPTATPTAMPPAPATPTPASSPTPVAVPGITGVGLGVMAGALAVVVVWMVGRMREGQQNE